MFEKNKPKEQRKEGIEGKQVIVITRSYTDGGNMYYNEIIGEVIKFKNQFLILKNCEFRAYKNKEIVEKKFIQRNLWIHTHIIAFIQELD